MTLALGLLIVAAAVYAVIRKVDVRLALGLAALMLGTLAGQPALIVQKFFTALTAQDYLIPIPCAMGFAYVLRQTRCDQHLVHLLVQPLRRARPFLIPGAVLVGFVVNIPIISQTSCAVAIGSVLVPLLLAARISPLTAGAAMLLGASIGGELLNKGAPEFRTVIQKVAALGQAEVASALCVEAVLPLVLVHLAVATALFWALSLRAEARHSKHQASVEVAATAESTDNSFRVNLLKAAVPLVPLVLLFLVAPPLEIFKIPEGWLVGASEPAAMLKKASEALNDPTYREAARNPFDSRLIGAAMLVGVAVAALTDRRAVLGVAGAFFEGAGYALTHIISLIVAASCFGEGVKLIGLDKPIGHLIASWPGLLLPASGFIPLAFAAISGSGIATTQSLFEFFAAPAVAVGIDPVRVGAVVSLGAAAGRTMSMVAAVVLMCASLTGAPPTDLVKRVAGPLVLGMTAVVIAAMIMSAGGH